jgi:sec-independent protein translocase protein TatC
MRIPKSKSGEMPFLDHLEELRWRIVYALGAILVGVALGFVIVLKWDLITVLQGPIHPYLPAGQKLVYLHPADPFSIIMQLSITCGIIFAIPVIGYQVWAFLSPALHKHERRIVIPVLLAATILFLLGASMAFFLVLPMSLKFFFDLGSDSLTPMITLVEYMGFMTSLLLTFGAAFEVPIVLVGLSAFGIVSPHALGKIRKFAIVGAWIVAAIITPGDLFTTTFALAVPLYLLYEMSVAVAFVIYRRKERRRAALEAADQSGAPA